LVGIRLSFPIYCQLKLSWLTRVGEIVVVQPPWAWATLLTFERQFEGRVFCVSGATTELSSELNRRNAVFLLLMV